MSETDEPVPSAWRRLFANGRVKSQRDLADKAGVSVATVNRMVRGIGRPDVESVRKVAGVLCDGDTNVIWVAIGGTHRDYGDFDLAEVSDELALLTPSQRKALLVLVRSMADPVGKRNNNDSDEGASGITVREDVSEDVTVQQGSTGTQQS